MMETNKPNKVILHCAASPDTKGETYFGFDACKRYHVEDRGWQDIGYHIYIERDGSVYDGRPLHMHGAHTKGQNKQSIGVCYEGSHLPTVAQIDSLCNVYRNLRSVFGFTYEDWFPHNAFKNKECPGFDIEDIQAIFRKLP
jgi:N-acetylmuramoyl-L-alanine amidase